MVQHHGPTTLGCNTSGSSVSKSEVGSLAQLDEKVHLDGKFMAISKGGPDLSHLASNIERRMDEDGQARWVEAFGLEAG